MSAENLLRRLDMVRRTGRDKWQSRCPAHDDKGPSLAIDDGRVLIHCFAGCGAIEILDAIGLNFVELYPPQISDNHTPKIRKPWNASDVLAALAFEILIAWNYSKTLSNGTTPSVDDQARLLLCVSRLQKGVEIANG